MKWQPIESAPKDQSSIIVTDFEDFKGVRNQYSINTAIAEWWPYVGHKELGGWVSLRKDDEENKELWFIPTHWAPIPEFDSQ